MGDFEKTHFPSVDESLLDDIFDFIYPNERHLFRSTLVNEYEALSRDDFKIFLIDNELNLLDCNNDEFYKRIEKLTNLNSSLDKFLTESNHQRYSNLIDSSFYSEFSEKFSDAVNKMLPNMRKRFDEYKVTTLYNHRKILRGYSLLNKLKGYIPLLKIYKELTCVREFVKKVEIPVVYRIIACAYGLHYSQKVSETDSRVLDTVFFNFLRDYFSRNIDKLVTNIFVKNQYKYNSCDKLLMLMIFGKTNEESSNYIISCLKDELISVTSLTLQKYFILENDFSGSKFTGLNRRDISAQASLLSPDLSLLVICKILSEFIAFFQNLCLILKYESTVLRPDYCKNNGSGSANMDKLLNSLNEADWHVHYKKCVDLFLSKYPLLVDISFEILYKLVSNFNFNSLKDGNDVLKTSLLILFYITLQDSFNDAHSKADGLHNGSNHVLMDEELVHILTNYCNKNLKFSDVYTSVSNTHLEQLEITLANIIANYSKKITSDHLENISISLTNDNFHRVFVNPVSFKRFQVDLFCTIFKNSISAGKFLQFGGYKFTSINPFLGWTPNSNFVTINLLEQLFVDSSTHALSNGDTMNNIDGYSLNRMARDYGGVYTLTSRMVLRTFDNYFKMILVHPTNTNYMNIIKHFTGLLDKFIYKNINACKIDALVIENLKRFNKLFDSQEIESFDSVATCDTHRTEFVEPTSVSDPARLCYVVNAVESCSTLLESLAVVMNQNRSRSPELYNYLKHYYRERKEVIMELRVVLYHVVIYNVLRPMMPSVALMQAVIEGKPLHISTDVDRSFRKFQTHLVYVNGFMNSVDYGFFPIMVRLLVWDSINNVLRDSFKPLLNLFNNNLNSELGKAIYRNYSETLRISEGIRAKYVDQVQIDYKTHKSEIANMSTYYNLVEELVESLK